MGVAASIIAAAAIFLVLAVKLFRLGRRADADGEEREDEAWLRREREAGRRREREDELMERLARLKEKRDDLALARDAVRADPERAAKAVSRMMRDKGK